METSRSPTGYTDIVTSHTKDPLREVSTTPPSDFFDTKIRNSSLSV
jgi:hypothetical protein